MKIKSKVNLENFFWQQNKSEKIPHIFLPFLIENDVTIYCKDVFHGLVCLFVSHCPI